MYAELGQRPYAPRNFWSEESGYLVPSVSIHNDVTEARAARRSPEYGVPFDWRAGTDLQALPIGVRDLLGSFGAVAAASLQGDDEYWTAVQGALAQLPTETLGLFDSMTSEAVRGCVERSVILECCRDDHIVKRDGTARNMYIVLDGAFEVRDADRVVRCLGPGEVFGENGFLRRGRRTADVFVMSETGRVLSLSDSTLRKFLDGDSADIRTLLRNIVAILAERLAEARELAG